MAFSVFENNNFDMRGQLPYIPKEEELKSKEEVLKEISETLEGENGAEGLSYGSYYAVVESNGRQGRAYGGTAFFLALLFREYELAERIREKIKDPDNVLTNAVLHSLGTKAVDFLYDFDKEDEMERFCTVHQLHLIQLVCNDSEIPVELSKKIIMDDTTGLDIFSAGSSLMSVIAVWARELFDDKPDLGIREVFPTRLSMEYEPKQKHLPEKMKRTFQCLEQIYQSDQNVMGKLFENCGNDSRPQILQYFQMNPNTLVLITVFQNLPKLFAYAEVSMHDWDGWDGWGNISVMNFYQNWGDFLCSLFEKNSMISKKKKIEAYVYSEKGFKIICELCRKALDDTEKQSAFFVHSGYAYVTLLGNYMERVKEHEKEGIGVSKEEVFQFAKSILQGKEFAQDYFYSIFIRFSAGLSHDTFPGEFFPHDWTDQSIDEKTFRTLFGYYRTFFGKELHLTLDEKWMRELNRVSSEDKDVVCTVFQMLFQYVDSFAYAKDCIKTEDKYCTYMRLFETGEEDLIQTALQKGLLGIRNIKICIKRAIREERCKNMVPYMIFLSEKQREKDTVPEQQGNSQVVNGTVSWEQRQTAMKFT